MQIMHLCQMGITEGNYRYDACHSHRCLEPELSNPFLHHGVRHVVVATNRDLPTYFYKRAFHQVVAIVNGELIIRFWASVKHILPTYTGRDVSFDECRDILVSLFVVHANAKLMPYVGCEGLTKLFQEPVSGEFCIAEYFAVSASYMFFAYCGSNKNTNHCLLRAQYVKSVFQRYARPPLKDREEEEKEYAYETPWERADAVPSQWLIVPTLESRMDDLKQHMASWCMNIFGYVWQDFLMEPRTKILYQSEMDIRSKLSD